METLKTFQIDLKNLSPANTYEYFYVLDDGFFKLIDAPEVKHGNVNVALTVLRTSSASELNFQIDGVVTVTCDRCLEDMEVAVQAINRLVVTFGETYAEISDEHIIVSGEEGFINVAWFMYEFIALAIPMKHVHESGACDEVMASKLRELCVDELNETEGTSESEESENSRQTTDPRWDVLRNLLEDN